jgi:hypothetical protein
VARKPRHEQTQLDLDQAAGYAGQVTDPTPDDAYALPHPGVSADGQPVPDNHTAIARAYLADHGLLPE